MQGNSATQPAALPEPVRRALAHSGLVDITTTGRKSGQPRRIEIAYHAIEGRIFISGRANPSRRRSWLANLEANPAFVFHLKRGVVADLRARARIVTDPTERRSILEHVGRAWQVDSIEPMVAASPLIEVTIEGPAEPNPTSAEGN